MSIYIRLVDYANSAEKENAFLCAKEEINHDNRYDISDDEFRYLPNHLFGYWLKQNIVLSFKNGVPLQDYASVKKGMTTADNTRFLRAWWEVDIHKIGFEGYSDQYKWFRTHKGGYFQKWYGNNENIVNWENDGSEIKSFSNAVIRNSDYYFKECITWTDISMSKTSFRYVEKGSISNASGPSIYCEKAKLLYLLGLLNSKVAEMIYSLLCPTIHFEVGQVALFPILEDRLEEVTELVNENINIVQNAHNSSETAWGFKRNPLL